MIAFALLLVMGTKFTKDVKSAEQSVQTDFCDFKDTHVRVSDGRAGLVRSWRVMVRVATFLARLRPKRQRDEQLQSHHDSASAFFDSAKERTL